MELLNEAYYGYSFLQGSKIFVGTLRIYFEDFRNSLKLPFERWMMGQECKVYLILP